MLVYILYVCLYSVNRISFNSLWRMRKTIPNIVDFEGVHLWNTHLDSSRRKWLI